LRKTGRNNSSYRKAHCKGCEAELISLQLGEKQNCFTVVAVLDFNTRACEGCLEFSLVSLKMEVISFGFLGSRR
jgi:hypothetical protein